METATWTIIPNDHEIRECWHPQYHKSPFKADSARVFLDWHNRQFPEGHPCFLNATVPLCIFGGNGFIPYTHNGASGTYAVCPSCFSVIICGYNNGNLNPRSCPECRTPLELNDYFQPLKTGKAKAGGEIDPKRDVAVTIAEIFALLEGKDVGLEKLVPIIFILQSEGLLLTGDFVDDVLAEGKSVGSRKINNRLFVWPPEWICNYPCCVSVAVSDSGKTMLQARQISPLPGARERALSLLQEERLDLLALRAFAESELAKMDRDKAKIGRYEWGR